MENIEIILRLQEELGFELDGSTREFISICMYEARLDQENKVLTRN